MGRGVSVSKPSGCALRSGRQAGVSAGGDRTPAPDREGPVDSALLDASSPRAGLWSAVSRSRDRRVCPPSPAEGACPAQRGHEAVERHDEHLVLDVLGPSGACDADDRTHPGGVAPTPAREPARRVNRARKVGARVAQRLGFDHEPHPGRGAHDVIKIPAARPVHCMLDAPALARQAARALAGPAPRTRRRRGCVGPGAARDDSAAPARPRPLRAPPQGRRGLRSPAAGLPPPRSRRIRRIAPRSSGDGAAGDGDSSSSRR